MPITINYTQLFFDEPLNVSIQKGDTVYYVDTSKTIPPTPPSGAQQGTVFEMDDGNIIEIGQVYDILGNTIVCEFACDLNITGDCHKHIPSENDFIMFSKDNAANMSSILGYYAEVKMSNNSDEKAKLFAVSADISESSK